MAPLAALVVDHEADVGMSGGSYQRQSWETLKRSTGKTSSREDEAPVSSDDQDMNVTSTDLVGLLQRTITIISAGGGDMEEAGQELMSAVRPGQETKLCTMIIEECCRHDDTRGYGLLAQWLCAADDPAYQAGFESCFARFYATTVHHIMDDGKETRRTARLYAHLLATNAVSWRAVLGRCVRLTEEDTTSSSRRFIKVLFQELSEQIGIPLLDRKMNHEDTVVRDALFPVDSGKNMAFAINFFTAIGLGGVTQSSRESLVKRRLH